MRLEEKSFEELHELVCAEAQDEGWVVAVANAMYRENCLRHILLIRIARWWRGER